MSAWRRYGCGGLILCGGRSSRMGYEKARLRFPDGPLLTRVLGRMRAVAQPVVLSLAPGQATPPLSDDVLTVKDSVANQGPLWGLAEGFRHLEGRCERVVVMPVDMPFCAPETIARLVDEQEGHAAALYERDGFANALTAAYAMTLRPKLEALLREGRRRPIFLIEGEDARVLTLPEDAGLAGMHPLMDVDTPEAYREALLLEGLGQAGAAEVTVEIRTPADAASVFPAGYVALYADRAADVLFAAQRLYPELAITRPEADLHLMRRVGKEPESELEPQAPLWRGEHLRLVLGDPGRASAAGAP